jgi:hypothetical protein
MSEPWAVTVRIDGLPKLPNAIRYRHWRIVQRERDLWHQLVAAHFCSKRPPKPLQWASLTFVRHSIAPPDQGNLAASWKDVEDGLVHAGVIVDDSPEHVRCRYLWCKLRAGKGYVTVQVRERAEPWPEERLDLDVDGLRGV